MCTVVLLIRPDHPWPLLLAANRDEMPDRPWQSPGRHWPDRPNVTAGLDTLAGGSWLGVNDEGVVAAILNRTGSLGPAAGKRSRGELVLEALDHADAAPAAAALRDLDPAAYRSFNMIVADSRDAFWIRHEEGGRRVTTHSIPPGLHMLTSQELDDPANPRIGRYIDRFQAAPAPNPDRDDWAGWEALLASSDAGPGGNPRAAMNFRTEHGFGTLSSALVALPAFQTPEQRWLLRFAAGRPGEAPWQPVSAR
jgi:uncharacterized protein with NRDE domain